MQTLILSDVHANLTALDAVLEDAGPIDRVWCLGDIVGYGPDPNECIERIRSLPGLVCVKGNHDAAVLGEIPYKAFNHEAQASLIWLESVIVPEHRDWLDGLEKQQTFDQVTLVHGSPRNPVWEYILDQGSAMENMDCFDTQICLVGHTHLPSLFNMTGGNPKSTRHCALTQNAPVKLNQKCILNPGSVGQPRDNDPRPSYLLYDDELDQWCLKRVDYEIRQVQDRILAAGLPKRHAFRLAEGW